jgi:hypothetical protein
MDVDLSNKVNRQNLLADGNTKWKQQLKLLLDLTIVVPPPSYKATPFCNEMWPYTL